MNEEGHVKITKAWLVTFHSLHWKWKIKCIALSAIQCSMLQMYCMLHILANVEGQVWIQCIQKNLHTVHAIYYAKNSISNIAGC